MVNGRIVMREASNDLKKHRAEFTRIIKSQSDGWETPGTDAAFICTIVFYFAKPKSAKRPHMTTTPDIDKCARFVLDAISDAGIWLDDKQVTDLQVFKRYADENLTEILVRNV
jgi:Holliday junction resolvase RusA-like endonuclease